MARSPNNAFLGKVKIEDVEYEYIINPDCVICNAYKNGYTGESSATGKRKPIKQSLRPEIDRYLIAREGSYKSQQFTKIFNKHFTKVKATKHALAKHVEQHSPYILTVRQKIKDAIAAVAEPAIEEITERHYEAEEVIQKIINKAGQGITDGSIEVTDKLITVALKEQGARQKYGTLTQMLESMDQDRFSLPRNPNALDSGEREQNKISADSNQKNLIDGEIINNNESAESTSNISRELD